MKVLLDIKESKAMFIMELLNSFSFVKIRPFTGKRELSRQKVREKTNNIVQINEPTHKKNTEKDIYADVWGIWADRDIDGKTLRRQAWGIED